MTKLKTIYKELGIKYDLREARKFLKVDKKLPRLEVNRLLKEKYNEVNPSGYIYTLYGTAYSVRGVPVLKGDVITDNKNYVIKYPQNINISFYVHGKMKKYRAIPCSVKVNCDKDVATNYKAISQTEFEDFNVYCNVPKEAKETLMEEGSGSEKVIDVFRIGAKATRRFNVNEEETMLF